MGVIEIPVLRSNGTILDKPGYDPETCLYYQPAPGLKIEVPAKPSKAELQKALELVKKLLSQFALPTKTGRANALALMLTPILRPAIPGHIPLAVLDAPLRGTGKTLLANTVALIATGRDATLFIPSRDEEEWRKKITTTLGEGASLILIDDLDILDVSCLSTVLTSHIWEDRVLGSNKSIRVPHRAIWMAAGNNVLVRGDLQRRCYWIRLDAKVSAPWSRDDFEIEDLTEWVKKKRGKLAAALLTIVRAWFAANKPMAKVPTFGSFQEWARTIGSILSFIGVPGFLDDLDKYRSKRDEESLQWEGFLQCWSGKYHQAVTVHELAEKIRQKGALRNTLPGDLVEALENPSRSFERVLGKALAKKEDVRFGEKNYRLKRAGTNQRAVVWRVVTD
jgi:hypothetical protein